ncbi:hypothetical protein KG112_18235 [Nocardioides sp. zg-ZUI104]|uniref:hypothetical protein n=1 Tax=Nocardioides faecalis TaxID=2803858 RepID=UPI001BCEDB15|nr:hypothetical protein [Nocardioides faecalis]MBS4754744.1 hypothetical protein [Nocardioides faecalis]
MFALDESIRLISGEMDALREMTGELEGVIATHRADDAPELRAAVTTLADSMSRAFDRLAMQAQLLRVDRSHIEQQRTSAAARQQAKQVVLATWVLSGATVVLAIATVALIFATLGA